MKNAKDIRLVLLDIDGTLINSPQSYALSEEIPKVIRAVMDKGILVGFASGRNFAKIDHHLGAIGVNGPLICNNGATVRDQKTTYFSRTLTEETLRVLWDFARRVRCRMELSADDFIYLHKFEGYDGPLFQDDQNRAFLQFIQDTQEDRDRVCKVPICKATLSSGSPEQAKAIWDGWDEISRTLPGTEQTRSFWFVSEIVPAGVSKESGLRLASEIWQIPLENIMVIGDGDNDVGMLECAGLSFAMENGSEAAKQAAQYIAPPVTRLGVVEVLREYILEEQDLPAPRRA